MTRQDWLDIKTMCQTDGWKALLLDLQNTAREWELYQRNAFVSETERLKRKGRLEHLQTMLDTEQRADNALAGR